MTKLTTQKTFQDILRFTVVALAGLAIDVSVAWVLSTSIGINLLLAATAGFLFGAIFNYLLHEFWTFRRSERGLSCPRILRYSAALGVCMIIRLAMVYILMKIMPVEQSELVILVLATIMSFLVNYLLSKRFVFNSVVSLKTPKKGN